MSPFTDAVSHKSHTVVFLLEIWSPAAVYLRNNDDLMVSLRPEVVSAAAAQWLNVAMTNLV